MWTLGKYVTAIKDYNYVRNDQEIGGNYSDCYYSFSPPYLLQLSQ